MDVKCERCGTEYEFDDARVTEAGVNVKCTHCGHLFKVARGMTGGTVGVPQTSMAEMIEEPEAPGPGGTPPPRGGQWMIRRADGEVLQFKDLSTLQKWIIERKVDRDDQISKTGHSWKPLGSIVELSSFFLVVDGAEPENAPTLELGPPAGAKPGAARRTGPLPASPPPPPPPPRGRDDLLDTGEFRLEGPIESVPPPPASPPSPARSGPMPNLAGQTPGRNGPLPMMAGQFAAMTPPTPVPAARSSWSQARIQLPPPTPVPEPQPHAGFYSQTPAPTPMPRQPTPMGIEIGAPPPTPHRGTVGTARGFVFGVLATGALLFVAYFVFDLLARSRTGPAPAPVSAPAVAHTPAPSVRPAANAQMVVKLDRADVDYARDTEAAFQRADTDYAAVVDALGQPPSDAVLAARALLGRARVAVTRAEYLRLEGRDAAELLVRAEQYLAAARELAPSSPDVDLTFADYFRVNGEQPSATRYVAKLEQTAPDRPELAFERAALALSEPSMDPAEAARRLSALKAPAVDLPRARYLQAVALRRAGRKEDAASVLVQLLSDVQDHEPARRLLTELGGAPPAPPSSAEARPAAPPSEAHPAVVEVEAHPAQVEAPAPPRPAPPPAPRPVAAPAPARPAAGMDYDALMEQGYRLLESSRSGEALAFFQQAADRKDRSPEPWANIGWCYMDQRNYAQAVTYFKKSLDRSPRYGDALFGLAEAFERAGQSQQALDAYRNYLDMHPTGSKAEMAQHKIDRLR